MPVDRLVELTSYHAILGCAVAGMGIALVPRAVVDSYAEHGRLSIHRMSRKFRSTRTVLIWRKGHVSAKVRALAGMLAEVAAPIRRAKSR